VGSRFLEKKGFSDAAVSPAFLGAFHLDRHDEALKLFENYREHFNDAGLLQKVAFSLMHAGRYKDAERMLIALYEKMTGAKYALQFDSIKNRYVKTIQEIPSLENRKDLNSDEKMQLGMAYLFSERYNEALSIFQSISKS
jgi:tetratricopeptide (TPR) repeat protein